MLHLPRLPKRRKFIQKFLIGCAWVGVSLLASPVVTPAHAQVAADFATTQSGFRSAAIDPNYVWVNDEFSKLAAMQPLADYVLHRVPGSLFDAPRIPMESNQALGRGHSLYGPGTPLYVGEHAMCTLTVAGYDAAGRQVGLTAAHCGEVGEKVSSADSWQVGATGTIVAKNPALDYAVIELGANAEVASTYNGVRAWGLGGDFAPGDIACKRGVATGSTCGVVWKKDRNNNINQICAMAGDSGAPIFKDGRVIGAISGGLGDLSCRSPWQGGIHAPTIASNLDAVLRDLSARGGIGAGLILAPPYGEQRS